MKTYRLSNSVHRVAAILAMALAFLAGPRPLGAETAASSGFKLDLAPGPFYATTTRWFIFSVPIYPQVACWLETPEGAYVETLYVTAKGARKNWVSAPAGGRPEALPVWFHIQQRSGAVVDSVSSPTPKGETARELAQAGRLPPGRYVVKLEVNRSYDYNEAYTKENSGVTGQPSLVYSCEIEVGTGRSAATFAPVGIGSVDGSDGSIRPGLDGITTALELFSSMKIEYRP